MGTQIRFGAPDSLELTVASAAAQILGRHGLVEQKYITAEFEPFSSAQRPDLVFWPASGPNEGRAFVVEIRMPTRPTRELPAAEVLLEHRDFLSQDSSVDLSFALATSRTMAPSVAATLSRYGIEVFEGLTGGTELAHRILSWSGVLAS